MSLQRIKKMKPAARAVGLGVLVFFLSASIVPDVGYAQGRYFREEWQVPGFYPRGFDGYGIIERISGDEVVISDTRFKLSPQVQYNTLRQKNTSDHNFSTGSQAAFLLNYDREIECLDIGR